MKVTYDLGVIARAARLFEIVSPEARDVLAIEMNESDARALSLCLGREVKHGTPNAALLGHAVVWVDDETPAPIPRGDQGGGASAPGEGARS